MALRKAVHALARRRSEAKAALHDAVQRCRASSGMERSDDPVAEERTDQPRASTIVIELDQTSAEAVGRLSQRFGCRKARRGEMDGAYSGGMCGEKGKAFITRNRSI